MSMPGLLKHFNEKGLEESDTWNGHSVRLTVRSYYVISGYREWWMNVFMQTKLRNFEDSRERIIYVIHTIPPDMCNNALQAT